MNLLLDTCTFVWLIADSPDLSSSARQFFSDPDNEVYLSAVSAWEIVIKHRLGRLPLPEPPRQFISRQRTLHEIRSLSLEEAAVLQLARLPDYHKDPFDRMLICQAIAHGLTILTPDPAITQYPVRTEW
ncbi:MAG: type II toxin-antitoxin system VapC family toxin [Candidatus Methylomirabilis oxygeniifera]|uniref:PilT-like protein n=1 Tax=Methylomirabilis oxygeniifera TaxID=671143 RepID=D5MLI7_METO1|nr:MAG: type II toxin-antitoxin system VapC family toxin [Candidatus Methylomirabilis oxyfera]CBE67853.1 PilT-like protein [Candidatus Methylomirabilis oxyfera]